MKTNTPESIRPRAPFADAGSPRAQRIRKLSRLFQYFCRLLLVLLVAAAVSVTWPQIQKLFADESNSSSPGAFIPAALLVHAYWGVALWLLERMFHAFAQHGVFHPRGARYLKWLGVMFLVSVIVPVLGMVWGLATGHSSGISQILTSLPSLLGMALLGTCVLMFGWVMEEACELREEQKLTI